MPPHRRPGRARPHHRRWALAFVVSLVPAVVALVAGPAEADTQDVVLEPEATAYFTSPVSDALPPVLTSEFPPGVVCIVAGIGGAPEVCGEAVQDLKALLDPTPFSVTDGLPLPESPDPVLPQPVLPGTLPVGLIGGVERYASYLRFPTPPVADGDQIDRLQLVLHEASTGITAAFDSPAFREASVAALSQVSEQSPDPFVELVERIAAGDTDLLGLEPTGIEACLVVDDWAAGDSQPGHYQPDIDCIFGSNGVRDPAAGTWTFDLTFIAQAWLEGTPNLGISLKPASAENLAYGDPDLSTNFLVSLAVPGAGGEQASLALTSSPVPPPPPPLPEPEIAAPPPLGNLVSGGSDPFAAPTVDLDIPVAPEVSVAPVVPTVPVVAPIVDLADVDSAWWVWLVLPLAIAGLWGYAGAVGADPQAARNSGGALTRLISARTSD